MATKKQIEANRLNAKKLTSTTTGAKIGEVVTINFQETADEFMALTAEYDRRFAPATLEERYLVSRLVHSEWLTRQLTRLDTATWNAHFVEDGAGDNSLGAVYFRAAKDLDKVGRGIDAADRSYHSALKRLLAIRVKRAAQAAKQPSTGNTGLFLVPKRS